MNKKRILLVEDEAVIADNIVYAVGAEGFEIEVSPLGTLALELLEKTHFDLVILDVGLPDMSGFEMCKQIRKSSEVPVMFLTARGDEIDRVVGLEIGADDYVVKPFSVRELVARIKVILKRKPVIVGTVKHSEKLLLDEDRRALCYEGQWLELTAHEFGVMQLLMGSPEQVFSREQIMENVWPSPSESYDRVVDTHVKSLRQKLKSANNEDDSIVTHRGFGYSFRFVK